MAQLLELKANALLICFYIIIYIMANCLYTVYCEGF